MWFSIFCAEVLLSRSLFLSMTILILLITIRFFYVWSGNEDFHFFLVSLIFRTHVFKGYSQGEENEWYSPYLSKSGIHASSEPSPFPKGVTNAITHHVIVLLTELFQSYQPHLC